MNPALYARNRNTQAWVEFAILRHKIVLNEDSASATGTGPHQQLRKHLTRHIFSCTELARKFGWLIDMQAFECSDPVLWRANMHKIWMRDHGHV